MGGSSARVGYSNGTAANSYELPGSGVPGSFLDSNLATGLIHNSNVGVDGRYVFQARNGSINPVAAVAAVPLPGVAWAGLALLGGLGAARRLRRREAESAPAAPAAPEGAA